MASSKEYLELVLENLSGIDNISHRKMMGEYILYKNGRVVGGIYDDRLLLKENTAVKEFLGDVKYEIPYPTAKPMIFIDFVDDRESLEKVFSLF